MGAPHPPNAAKLLLALGQFGCCTLGLAESDFLLPGCVVQLGYPPARIDILTSIDGVDFDSCVANRTVISVDGVALPLIGLSDFKSNKRASGRTKDLADLESLDQDRKSSGL